MNVWVGVGVGACVVCVWGHVCGRVRGIGACEGYWGVCGVHPADRTIFSPKALNRFLTYTHELSTYGYSISEQVLVI